MTEVILSSNLTSIDNSVFNLCNKLESINIPNGITNIGQFAFADCSKLDNIIIPDSVTDIGWGAFWSCTSLIQITIPPNVTVIGNNAFNNCPNLAEVIISDGVTHINGNAFEGCSSLHNIVIPNSVIIVKRNDIQVITFPRYSVRDYFAISINEDHLLKIAKAITNMVNGIWGSGKKPMCRLPIDSESALLNETPNSPTKLHFPTKLGSNVGE